MFRPGWSEWTQLYGRNFGPWLFDGWGTKDDLFAVGDVVLHYDGKEWMESIESAEPIRHVWGTEDDVWMTGPGMLWQNLQP